MMVRISSFDKILSKEELDMLKVALSKAKEGIQCYFKEGMAAAQNKFN